MKPDSNLVLLCDEALLVVDKPAGLPTLPDGYDPQAPHLKSLLEPEYGRLWIVHRLDRFTSGVIVLARTAQAHRALNAQFQEHTVEKVYHAIVTGDPDWDEMTIDLPLRADGDRRHRTLVDSQSGKPSVTRFRVMERFAGYSLVQAVPHTGRVHQIRAHLRAAGFPLAGDALYGGALLWATWDRQGSALEEGTGSPLLARPALHAWSLTFQHPLTGQRRRFEAPYPPDLEAALAALREDRGYRLLE